MPAPLLDILVELPLVAVTVYLVQHFLRYINERDAEWRAHMNTTTERLSNDIRELTAAVERLSERTALRDFFHDQ